MCGRFVGFTTLEMLQEHFPIDVADVQVTPNYNVAPTQEILAITDVPKSCSTGRLYGRL